LLKIAFRKGADPARKKRALEALQQPADAQGQIDTLTQTGSLWPISRVSGQSYLASELAIHPPIFEPPQFDRVPKAELDWKQIRKGIIKGKDPKGLQQRMQRGGRAAGSDERQAHCPDGP
jgi:hypothetical protein